MVLIAPLLALALQGTLFRYDVKESVSATTPRGEEAHAAVGKVTVAGGNAVWELTGGRFPRSQAQAAIVSRGRVTLLARDERVYAEASPADFDALFVPRAGDEAGASFLPRDVSVSLEPAGAGAPFGEAPTERWRLTASWRLAIEAPGRAGAIETKVTGTIVAAPSFADARSPFDDPLRLLPVRGELREAFARELAKVKGLPVLVEIELDSQSRGEPVGPAPPQRPDPSARPPRTVTRIVRRLANPERRPARETDGALFEVPGSYHAIAIERLAHAEQP